MKNIFIILFTTCSYCIATPAIAQQEVPIKINLQITGDELGNATCEMQNKYTAAAWDFFTKSIGNNTSIIKNNMIRMFPKYELKDFEYSQDADDRTNTVKFKILGLMKIDKDGNWKIDLEKKDPDIKKVSGNTFLLMDEGNSLTINLPASAKDAIVKKDSFGKAFISYPASESGGKGMLLMLAGAALLGAGAFMLFKNMKQPALKTIYEPVNKQREALRDANVQIAEEVKIVTPQSNPSKESGNSHDKNQYGQY
ncbi:MAG TPA: hypothetical protein PK504_07840 [Ferruginibacter sp.]|nr:hypothetical protein [Ferruginibacter sp.]HRE62269.1 hypothetical protein [Ferruginibacter sp.]